MIDRILELDLDQLVGDLDVTRVSICTMIA